MIKRGTRRILHSAAALVALPFLSMQKTESKKSQSNEPVALIRIDVSKFADANRELDGCVQCVQIAFVDDNLLALTFMKFVVPLKSTPDHKSAKGPIPFRTVFLDAKTGQQRAAQDWSGATGSLTFLPTHEGKFLLATSEQIELYSGSLQLLGRRDLPPNGPGSAGSHATVSWSGKRIVVKSYQGKDATRLELLDADSLQVLHSWVTAENFVNLTATDDAIAVETPHKIQFFDSVGSWPAAVQADRGPCMFPGPTFISNDLLAFRNCENEISVMGRSGKVLVKSQPFEPNTSFYSITTSENGLLFGILVHKTYCAASWFVCTFDSIAGSTPKRTAIYDASTGRVIFERQTAGDRKRTLGEIALSPNGSLLAILYRVREGRSDGIIEIFALPSWNNQNLP